MKLSTSLTVVLDTVKSFFVHGWQFRKIRYWDACYFFRALEILFGNMEKSFRYSVSQKYHYVGIEKDIKTLMICKNLTRRLADEDYWTCFDKKLREYCNFKYERIKSAQKLIWPAKGRTERDLIHRKFKREAHLQETDLELLCKLIKTRVSKMWW